MSGAHRTEARVVLVGRTGFEQVLRVDSGVELARVRGPLDALAELAEMTRLDDVRPATVILSAGIVPDGQVSQFAGALKSIDSNVRLMGVGSISRASEFDGVLASSMDAEAVGRLVRNQSPVVVRVEPSVIAAQVQPMHAQSMPVQTVSVQSAPVPSAAAPTREGDVGPLEAMLGGQDVLAAALAHLSTIVGVPCVFVPAKGQAGAGAMPTTPVAGAPVRRGSRVLGTLSAKGVAASVLEPHTPWLAGWITLSAQQDQLRRAAFTDELTGAWNRRYFTRYLAAAIAAARESRHNVSLMVFDVDNFKSYNDRFGHAAGDEILAETVKLLGSVIRPTDRVCRIGGDEFAVIFHDPEGPRNPGAAAPLGPTSIAQIASRFQKQICEHRFPRLMDQAPGTLTISAGLATFPWDGASPEQLLERADALALQSKRQGKNVITFGPGAMRVCDIDRA